MSETTARVGGEAVVGTALPETQRRSVWPRAPAQRGRKRALEVGRTAGPRILGGGDCGSALGARCLKDKTSPTCSWTRGAEGRSGGRCHWLVGGRCMFSKNRRELQS